MNSRISRDSRLGGRSAGKVPADAPSGTSRAWRLSTRPHGTAPTGWAVAAAVLIVALLTAGLHLLFH